MFDQENPEISLQAMAVELKYITKAIDELKISVDSLSQIVTDTRIKVAGQASIFGLLGGGITAGAQYLIQKIMHP